MYQRDNATGNNLTKRQKCNYHWRGYAAGNHIPPYCIFPGKRWNEELLKGTSPGTKGEMGESGWSIASSFMNYLQNHFIKFISRSQSVEHLIIFDGHRSHVSLSLTDWGKEHDI